MASERFLSKSVDFPKFYGIIILKTWDFKEAFYELSFNRRYDNYDDTYIVPAVVIFKIVDAILWKAEVKERKKQNEEK